MSEKDERRRSRHHGQLNFIDISTLQDDECIDVTEEQLEEFRKREAR
jgi:hypothetical protein